MQPVYVPALGPNNEGGARPHPRFKFSLDDRYMWSWRYPSEVFSATPSTSNSLTTENTCDPSSDVTMLLLAPSVVAFMAAKIALPDGMSPASRKSPSLFKSMPFCQASLLAFIVTPKPSLPVSGPLLYCRTLQPVPASTVVFAYWINQSTMSPIRPFGASKSGTPTVFRSVVIA